MPRSRKDIRSLLAIFGVVILLATTVITLGTARPTEATWQDTVHGASTFGAHENTGVNFAHSTAGYGEIRRSLTTGDLSSHVSHADGARRYDVHTDPGFETGGVLGFVRASGTDFSCARSAPAHLLRACSPAPLTGSPTSYAVSYLQDFNVHVGRIEALLRLRFGTGAYDRGVSFPAVARAECRPGQEGRTSLTSLSGLLNSGPLLIGAERDYTAMPIPPANTQSEATHIGTGNIYTYKATLQHVQERGIGHAKTQLRLKVEADGNLTRWNMHVILAHAECGASHEAIAPPTMPRVGDWPELETQVASQAQRSVAAREVLADHNSAEDEGKNADDANTSPESENESEDAVTTSTEENAPTESTEASTTTVDAPAAPAGPQRPQEVRVGREFAVVTREGVELGTARIEDVRRLPDCGVEITMEIATAAEDGPDRWASIDHRDFAEVRPGGSIRPAQRASSECASTAATGPAQLRAGGVNEVVVVIQLSDTAQRALFRPDGTAGWRFDLPLPTPTATAPATTTSTTAAASPSPTAPATTRASAPPQDTAVASAP